MWNLATLPLYQHQQLEYFHGPACWSCGVTAVWRPGRLPPFPQRPGPPLPTQVPHEVDHVRPLWSLTDAERLELRWWLPFNLQLLCVGCHKAKTKREARDRARGRLRARVRVDAGEQLELAV
jgi:5-methylcytosine-specific restriction endonuclease McrA